MDNKQDNVPQVKTVEAHAEELFDKYGYYVDDNLSSMDFVSGRSVIMEADFKSACLDITKPLVACIAELEAGLLHQKEQNKRISNQIELSEEANAIVRSELEASNAKLREVLERVRSMSSSVSIDQNRKIRFFITEALNSKDAGGAKD